MTQTGRDTDWYSITVDNSGIYTVNVVAEFDGLVAFADVSDCANLILPSQGNFTANTPFTLSTSLSPGTYAVVLVPSFDQSDIDCAIGYNAYTLELSGGSTIIAPVSDVCETADPVTLFAAPSGGTWSGTGITDANAGTFDPLVAGIGSFVITYTTANGCASNDTLTVNVVEAPQVDFVGLAASYCPSDEAVELIGLPSGGTFSINNGGTISGSTFNPATTAPGAYDITYTANANGVCSSSITQSVIISTAPAVSFNLADSTCSGNGVIILSATPAGGSFSGQGVFGNEFDPILAGIGTTDVLYSVTVSGEACPGTAVESILVNPSPVVQLSGLATTYCLASSPVQMIGTPALGTFSGPGVSGSTFNPATAGVGTHIITYQFDNGTCVGSSSIAVTVTDNLTVAINAPSSVCSNDDPFVLTSSPSGAVFSGPGVFGQTFSPQAAGVGTHTITATINTGTCFATATQTITVSPAPNALFSYSANGSTVSFANASTNATTYSWNFGDGQTSTAVNPTHVYTTNGSYTIDLIASSPSCGSDTFSVRIELSVGIGSIDGVDMIQLYPNPTEGVVNLAFNSLVSQSFEIRINDALGRLIEVDNVNNYSGKFAKTYSLENLADGVYSFSVSSDKGAINFRVVKN
jgi:PKD repeat protein